MSDRSKLPRRKVEAIKQKEDAELTKIVYQDFLETFEEAPKSAKTFVRGGTLKEEPGGSRKFEAINQGKLYKPEPSSLLGPKPSSFDEARRQAKAKAEEFTAKAPVRPTKLSTKKKEEKKMTNLEAFKEELKRMQEERAERRKIRQQLKDQLGITQEENLDKIAGVEDPYLGSYETDPTTTNIYLSNLSPKMTEADLYRIFGSYGPLGSVKIMWPRTDDEKSRGYMCGFVAFMSRKDGERAIHNLRGKLFKGFELKLGWGKPVTLPPHPIYIPEKMLELTLPPPPSGLPFNAQASREELECYPWPPPPPGSQPPDDEIQKEPWERLIRNAVVKVVIPTERPLLALIHRMIEFVIREGPLFEAMIMNRELNNPAFRFLFDNQSPAHVYYRWKLFSMLQGDSATEWNMAEFRMFKDGSMWRPPPVNFFCDGMPEELYDDAVTCSPSEEGRLRRSRTRSRSRSRGRSRSRSRGYSSRSRSGSPVQLKRGQLSDAQRDRLEDIIRHLKPERSEIATAMLFCLEHADASEEIVDCITESLSNPDTVLVKKVARIYLISDVLSNCTAKVMNASSFRKFFQVKLEEIFQYLSETFRGIEGRLKAEQFRSRVMACIRAWEEATLYPLDFIIKLQNIFLGLTASTDMQKIEDRGPLEALDGVPLDLDGSPLGGDKSDQEGDSSDYHAGSPEQPDAKSGTLSPVDEKPNTEEVAAVPPAAIGMFVRSKWEEVEPEIVEAQAVTSSKWESLPKSSAIANTPTGGSGGGGALSSLVAYDDDLDGMPMDDDTEEEEGQGGAGVGGSSQMSDEKRAKLREIEVKVVQYQDELEAERRKHGKMSQTSINEEVEKYRTKLLERAEAESGTKGSSEASTPERKRKKRQKSRSRSPKKSKRHKRSRSKSAEPKSKHKKHRKR